ncbi:hypothetical protein FGO68_gene7838 [Halteria grandinella]|uniref:Uncharacterized protein n=1 Tax=Halteria grandinella TaxID=5974 RepID=A0A8J8NKF4_HALGN|nr:hypothetical protein FGO68_gene7838 [Halteria grandinella]
MNEKVFGWEKSWWDSIKFRLAELKLQYRIVELKQMEVLLEMMTKELSTFEDLAQQIDPSLWKLCEDQLAGICEGLIGLS